MPEFIQPNYDENGEEQNSEDGDQPLNFDHDDGNIVMDRHELIDDIFECVTAAYPSTTSVNRYRFFTVFRNKR